jgi:hypothetical protein
VRRSPHAVGTLPTLALAFATLTLGLGAGGCVVRFGEGNFDDDDATGGAGGKGGAAVASASSGSATPSGTAGSGGGPSCVGEAGSGETATVCETLPSAGASCTLDGQSVPAFAVLACRRGFEAFNPGHAEHFAACLATIDPARACDLDAISSCAGALYDASCPSAYTDALCADYAKICAGGGEALDQASCAIDLRILDDGALEELVTCMNGTAGTCQTRYDACLEEVLTVRP